MPTSKSNEWTAKRARAEVRDLLASAHNQFSETEYLTLLFDVQADVDNLLAEMGYVDLGDEVEE